MPHITLEFKKGRSAEQKAEFARLVTDGCVDILGARRQDVILRFVEADIPIDVAEGGELIQK